MMPILIKMLTVTVFQLRWNGSMQLAAVRIINTPARSAREALSIFTAAAIARTAFSTTAVSGRA
jgi:hypothetical protein